MQPSMRRQGMRGKKRLLGGVLAVLLGGCQTDAWYLTTRFPPGNPLAPDDSSISTYVTASAQKAEADHFVVYENEWYMGGKQLGPYGSFHASQIAKNLPSTTWPVVIQRTLNAELDAARRSVVVKYLLDNGIVDADQRVVLGFPDAEGLYGEEAPIIYGKLLRTLSQGGGVGGYGAGGLGGGNLGNQNLFGSSGGIGAFGPFGGAAGGAINRPNFSPF